MSDCGERRYLVVGLKTEGSTAVAIRCQPLDEILTASLPGRDLNLGLVGL